MIHIFVGKPVVADFLAQVVAEWLYNRENHLSGRCNDGVALDEVEASIGVILAVGIDIVEVHHLNERLAIDVAGGNVVDFGSGGVAQVLNVELEIGLLHLVCPKRIHILHHELPVGQFWRHGSTFQHLHIERLRCRGDIARKLSHLIGLSAIGVLERHGKHLIGSKCRLQRDVAQRAVECIFARSEQSGTLHLLIVASALDSVGFKGLQGSCHLGDFAGIGIVALHLLKQVV